MTTRALTPARKRALEVMAQAETNGYLVHVSNVTTTLNRRPRVYWQTADWLIASGFAELLGGGGADIRLTDAGRDLVKAAES